MSGEALTVSSSKESNMMEGSSTTPQRKNTGESAATQSSLSTMTPTDTDSPEDFAETEKKDRVEWSETLASPVIASFSPSLTVALHGYGIKTATDRARQLTNCGRRSATLLLEVATLYEPYADALLKAAQSLQGILGQPNGKIFLALQEAIVGWSQELTKLTQIYRVNIGQPLQTFLVMQLDCIQGMNQRYHQSRLKARDLRQRALAARKKYLRAFEEAEACLSNSEDDDKSPSKSSLAMSSEESFKRPLRRRTASKLEAFKQAEKQYLSLVKQENEAVRECHMMETILLESLQQLEEDRLLVVSNNFSKVLSHAQQALAELDFDLQTDVEFEGMGMSTANVVSKKSKKSLTTLLKSSSRDFTQFEDGAGAMDADTLGLPEEVGKLRDEVRAKCVARINRVQVARVLSVFLENVASASAKFGLGLKQALQKEQAGSASSGALLDEMKEYESPETLDSWTRIADILSSESQDALGLASYVRQLRSEKLDQVVLYGDRNTKQVAELDDSLWKQLCDAARVQSKAELRFRQTTAQIAKARERIKSVDKTGEGDSSTQNGRPDSKVNQKVSKGLANMFSILPDGGEQAMKIFAPGARATIAQKGLEDADAKETKGRQQLDAAVEAASQALEAYKAHASSLVNRYDKEDKTGWDDICATASQLAAEADRCRSERIEKLKAGPTSELEPNLLFLENWRASVQNSIMTKAVESDDTDLSAETGFMLPQELLESDLIDISLHGNKSQDGASGDVGIDAESTDGDQLQRSTHSDPATPTWRPTADVDPSSPVPDIQACSSNDSGSANWLRKEGPTATSPTKSLKSAGALRTKPSLGLGSRSMDTEEQGGDAETDIHTEIFLKYFWPDQVERSLVPAVVGSFACSFRDGSHRLPYQYGRIFFSSARTIFVSWTGKKLNLQWSDVIDLEPVTSFMSAAEDTVMLTSKKNESGEEAYSLLGGLTERESVLALVRRLREDAKKKTAEAEAAGADATEVSATGNNNTSDVDQVPRSIGASVPPDVTLQKMEVVLDKHLRNLSIQRFYGLAWSEGNGTSEDPLYRPWLEKICFDVEVGDWEKSPTTGPWCGERFDQKRVVTFKVQRKTHLYIGPPIANVKQTHYCRVEGDDKCVVAMTVELDGIPYSDTFNVEVRWVARRFGANDINVQVGLFVNFKKNTFLKAKIRSGTIEECE